MAKKCQDYVGDLNLYLDGGIDPDLCDEIERHIGECENCRIMVDSLRQTVILCREGKPEQLPAELEAKLSGLLRQRWNQKFGKKPQ